MKIGCFLCIPCVLWLSKQKGKHEVEQKGFSGTGGEWRGGYRRHIGIAGIWEGRPIAFPEARRGGKQSEKRDIEYGFRVVCRAGLD